jgi:hypothetical protein
VVCLVMSLPLDEIRRLVSLLETHQGADERKEVVSKLYDVLVCEP